MRHLQNGLTIVVELNRVWFTDRVAISVCSLSHPNSGLPEFGSLSRPKSDKSDFGWEREQTEFAVFG
jgi:hypothetical protein